MTSTESERALARKVKVRAGHRASAKRLTTQAEAALVADPLSVPDLRLLITNLTKKAETLAPLDAEILELIADEAIEGEIEHADQYQENIQAIISRITHALLPSDTPTSRADVTPDVPTTRAHTPTAPTTPPTPTTTESGGSAHSSKVKLPKLTLPHFNGNPLKWATFWDSYESAIHSNEGLNNVDKFNYLRSLLEGSALEAVRGLTLTAANYGDAISILKKRFGNRQVIVSKHMETLLNIEAVTSDQNVRGLRKLYNEVEANTRSLKALGIEPESYGAMLASVLLGKLPPDLRLLVGRKMTDDELTLSNLQLFLEEELTARERTAIPNQGTPRRTEKQPRSTTASLLSGAQSQVGPVCSYCQQAHPSVECTTVVGARDRREILKSSGRCFNCLRRGHMAGRCKSQSSCRLCKKRHHTSICEGKEPAKLNTEGATNQSVLNPDAPTFESTSTTLCSSHRKTVLLQTARAKVYNPSSPHRVAELRALLDSGSQRSYITERAQRLLGLRAKGEEHLSIATFGSERGAPKVCPVITVGMNLKDYPHLYPVLIVVPTICEPLVGQPITECVEGNEHLASLELADINEGDTPLPIDILIGSDYYWEIVTGKICRGENGPTGIHTKFGWVLSGPTESSRKVTSLINLTPTHVMLLDTKLDQCLQSFWDLESLGICGPEKTVYDEFSESVSFVEGRYQVSLPWKLQHKPLPDNYQLSRRRLDSLLKRLRQNPEVLQRYDNTIQEQIRAGIVEDAPSDVKGKVHYLPHHAVIRTDKSTTKLRIVYDASAKADEKAPSLNECLQVGPKFNQKLFNILIRFRAFQVAVSADIEKAFLMVSVEENDRDVLRFLWVGSMEENPPQIRPLRFTRVVFGVSSSPFLLNATIHHHLTQYRESHPDLVELLVNSFYVDDLATGANSEEDAYSLYSTAKQILREGGFNLRKFCTNSESLQQRVDAAEGSGLEKDPTDESYVDTTLGSIQSAGPRETRILGIRWNPQTDCLNFSVSEIAQAARGVRPTKRNVVSVVGRFFDPLGFLAPIVIKFKLLFQKLCVERLDWDEQLPENLLNEWNVLIHDLQADIHLSIPRCYLKAVDYKSALLTLCGFCDASTKAYAAVVYLRAEVNSGVVVQFVASKTRVAPTQAMTIPRLELMSALLLARLVSVVSANLDPLLPSLELKCYTDSTVAYYWIERTAKEWKPFVNNRVKEIRSLAPPGCWHHCPGKTNPADLPSRGLTTTELSVSKLWHCGPLWLLEQNQDCGQEPDTECMPEECAAELKKTHKETHALLVTTTSAIGNIINDADYSTLARLIRVTAFVLRAVTAFKRVAPYPKGPLSQQELIEAEKLWIMDAQRKLKAKNDLKMWQKQYNLFTDDSGLIRCRGRLENASLPYSTKYPLFLPRDAHFTLLVVREAHNRVMHNGVKETLTEVRRRYWINKGRSFARSVIYRCVRCRRHEGAPFKTPMPPALPAFRIQEQPPFTYTGVDYAGPLYTRSEGVSKVWICLFTCCVTRAVHLELVTSMSASTFIRCLKRFAARRGMPRKILSDNGKSFKATATFLEKVFKDDTVVNYLSTLRTEWLFNVEKAPWWGGVFERLIKSMKRCLRKCIGQARFSLDELHTAVVEVESILNSRPLSYLSPSDLEEPLTPSHLITGRRVINLPDDLSYQTDLDDEEFTLNQDQVRRRVKYSNLVLNHFWKRWRQEYLAELRESHRNYSQRCSGIQPISVGDVVVIHDDSLPRGFWKLGLVEELIMGKDGIARAASLRLASKDGRHSLLRRPIQRLYPLEVHKAAVVEDESPLCEDPQQASQKPTSSTPRSDEETSSRPKRAAALRSEARRRAWIAELSEDC